jgi:hypothetical protein
MREGQILYPQLSKQAHRCQRISQEVGPLHYRKLVYVLIRRSRIEEDETQLAKHIAARSRKRKESRQRKVMVTPDQGGYLAVSERCFDISRVICGLHVCRMLLDHIFDDIKDFQRVSQSFSHSKKVFSIALAHEIRTRSPDGKESTSKVAFPHFWNVHMSWKLGC